MIGRATDHTTSEGPRHVAFVMDGNGRWATRRGLQRTDGHRAGIANVAPVAYSLLDCGVEFMTIYMFSTENWKRPQAEVSAIFDLLREWLTRTAPGMKQRGIGFRHYGRREPLPADLLDSLDEACRDGGEHELVLGLAVNYGGRPEIVDAVKSLLADRVRPSDIDEDAIEKRLYTAGVPAPDLVVRPGGERRLSNFLLWQAAYAELYFTGVLWPDFGADEVAKALEEYSRRNRRFGGLQ
jgi:undecaprenyl diphosphate synthase